MGYLIKLNKRKPPVSIGNKALNLFRLSRNGIQIPETYVVSWKAYQHYLQDNVALVDQLRRELAKNIEADTLYAVRSSANIEDSIDRSFAGQFKSVLNVTSVDGVFQAIWSIWGTAKSAQVVSYLKMHGITARDLYMAVIIQKMIQPVFAGVVLSRNPVTGADEIVVEAVEGCGEALVQTGVTPMRWINKWDNWISQPEPNGFPQSLIDQIVTETRLISEKLKAHVDLEWVYDGKQLYWLQVREITTLNQHNVYSNHISKEMVPGMIKPLIGSVNIPLVCAMWVRILTELLGKTSVKAEDLAKPFYYRVYFNMGTMGQIFQEIGLPADSVETLMGIFPDVEKPSMRPTLKTYLHLPSILAFLFEKWQFAGRMHKALPRIEQRFQTFDYQTASQLEENELLNEIDRLFDIVQEAAYYNIVGPLLLAMYNQVLKNQLAKKGVDFSEFDLMAGVPEITNYDPTYHLHVLHERFINLDPDIQDKVRSCTYAEFISLPELDNFQNQVTSFIDRFGYLSDNGNDFSFIPWRESPDVVLALILNFTPASKDSKRKIRLEDLSLRGFARLGFLFFYKRAREFHLLRERIGAAYNHGYGLFRYYYLALGSHLVQRGLIDTAEDIFFLRDEEVRHLVAGASPSPTARELIARHKEDIKRFSDITLPTVIYGDDPPPVEDTATEKLIGVPTSIGHYTGRVTVVRGLSDFNKVEEGDVLVIPYSDVGWTPLFARAGAVIAESGGMLSHSSIIAREYNIPAVVSVANATNLPDHAIITVNGHSGEVIIHQENHQEL